MKAHGVRWVEQARLARKIQKEPSKARPLFFFLSASSLGGDQHTEKKKKIRCILPNHGHGMKSI